MENTSATLTVKELAEYLNIGKNTAYSLIHAGAIESFRIGNQIRSRQLYWEGGDNYGGKEETRETFLDCQRVV